SLGSDDEVGKSLAAQLATPGGDFLVIHLIEVFRHVYTTDYLFVRAPHGVIQSQIGLTLPNHGKAKICLAVPESTPGAAGISTGSAPDTFGRSSKPIKHCLHALENGEAQFAEYVDEAHESTTDPVWWTISRKPYQDSAAAGRGRDEGEDESDALREDISDQDVLVISPPENADGEDDSPAG
ncbi:unnamed protein product, partial [Amoebophrya sp. A120]